MIVFDVHLQDGKSGRTALHYAVEYGIHRVTKFLLEECPIGPSGVQLEMPTYAGYTAYQLATCIDSALARELADKGAHPMGLPDDDESDSDSDEEVRTWIGANVCVEFKFEKCERFQRTWQLWHSAGICNVFLFGTTSGVQAGQ